MRTKMDKKILLLKIAILAESLLLSLVFGFCVLFVIASVLQQQWFLAMAFAGVSFIINAIERNLKKKQKAKINLLYDIAEQEKIAKEHLSSEED